MIDSDVPELQFDVSIDLSLLALEEALKLGKEKEIGRPILLRVGSGLSKIANELLDFPELSPYRDILHYVVVSKWPDFKWQLVFEAGYVTSGVF